MAEGLLSACSRGLVKRNDITCYVVLPRVGAAPFPSLVRRWYTTRDGVEVTDRIRGSIGLGMRARVVPSGRTVEDGAAFPLKVLTEGGPCRKGPAAVTALWHAMHTVLHKSTTHLGLLAFASRRLQVSNLMLLRHVYAHGACVGKVATADRAGLRVLIKGDGNQPGRGLKGRVVLS